VNAGFIVGSRVFAKTANDRVMPRFAELAVMDLVAAFTKRGDLPINVVKKVMMNSFPK